MQTQTREVLYPNPTVRAKMVTDKGISTLGVSRQPSRTEVVSDS
jgi:hypothetical protein